MLTEDGVYLGARDMKFAIFPGSGVKKKPKWVMAAEIVETRRVYARTVATDRAGMDRARRAPSAQGELFRSPLGQETGPRRRRPCAPPSTACRW
jgi:HrpA-like RNA helicase